MKTKFILHGGFTKEDNESNSKFFEEFIKDIPDSGKILLVYFASETEEKALTSCAHHTKILEEKSGTKNLHISRASKENFLEEVRQADAVLFNGGRTKNLLDALKDYPNLKAILENKTIAGSSAGAYMLATMGATHEKGEVREGLGAVPLKVVCHHESKILPPEPSSVEILKNTRPDLEMVYLKDYEWKVFSY